MLELSSLRWTGIIFGFLALGICFLRLRTYSGRRANIWFLFLFGLALISISSFPSLTNFPSSILSMDGYQGGRLIALLIISNIVLWFLVLYQRAKSENRYYQYDNLVRSLTVTEFLKEHTVDSLSGNIVVLIPAYNEAENLKVVRPLIPKTIDSIPVHILVIDDGSTDGTKQALLQLNTMVAAHPTNRGGGAALKTGYDLVTHLCPAVVLTMDADGQHHPSEIETLVRPILKDEADFVIGSRILGKCANYSSFRLLGVHVFSRLINFIMGTNITDCSSGFRAIKGEVLDQCLLLQEQYHTAEVIIEVAKRGYRITERPVTISNRLSGESKKGHDIKYGLFFLRTIVKTWLR